MAYERNDEDMALAGGHAMASGPEYLRRVLAALLRIEDALAARELAVVTEYRHANVGKAAKGGSK